jgi:hypothetical protein
MKDIPDNFEGYNHFEIRHHVIDIFWKILKVGVMLHEFLFFDCTLHN